MRRPWQIWLAFGTSLALVAAAVGWLSLRALSAERAEQAARQQADLEEKVRLALWRMDSALSGFLAQENARPVEAYRPPSLTSTEDEISGRARRRAPASVPVSPPPQVRLYFQISPEGSFSSPDASNDAVSEGVPPGETVTAPAERAHERLAALRQLTSYRQLLPELPAPAPVAAPELMLVWSNGGRGTPNAPFVEVDPDEQRARNTSEFRNRSQVLMQNSFITNNSANGNRDGLLLEPDPTSSPAAGILSPVVCGGELVLARQAHSRGRTLIQGAWLDWPVVRNELQLQIADLLPSARFEISRFDSDSHDEGRRLALLPIRLDPGPFGSELGEHLSPVKMSLITAWSAMALAALSVAALLAGVVTLSERRADFVSAVTHELRTPLTTFRMYAEMLSSGMVNDETKRRQYLATLETEADRLTHLVENVLAYARLERGGLGNRLQAVTGKELLSAATQRLAERAAQAGFEWKTELDAGAAEARLLADPSAVEQILFNLVDNACKYAATDQDRTLHLRASVSDREFVVRLSDCGPGFSVDQRRRLFQPFRKSATEAARTAPGVGLGLSLSRRLARDMGGDLRLDSTTAVGATFELTLRLAPR